MSNTENAQAAPAAWQMPKLRGDNGLTLKAVAAVALSIVALVPLTKVQELIEERWTGQQHVIEEIGQSWGEAQRIAGPYLKIPLTRQHTRADGGVGTSSGYLLMLAKTMDIVVDVQTELRHRGVFDAVVYVADVTIEGRFPDIDQDLLPANLETVDWDNVSLHLDISQARDIKGEIAAQWQGAPVAFQTQATAPAIPGTGDVLAASVTMVHAGNRADGASFRINYQVAGSRSLGIVPTAGQTAVVVRSPWTAPSFDGAFLPASSDVDAEGFTAQWVVSDYARGFPLTWLNGETPRLKEAMARSVFGVQLIEEVGLYRKTERAVKYGLLFFAATFLTFLILEVTTGARLHILHYGLVGAALCVFYVLLLSLGEVIGFPAAYAASAAAVVAQTSVFTWAVVRRASAAMAFAAVLAGVYAYLYILLDLEDLALLGGALGLFVLLSAAMYALRGVGKTPPAGEPEAAPSQVSS